MYKQRNIWYNGAYVEGRERGQKGGGGMERKTDRQTKACAVHKIAFSEQQVLDTHGYILYLSSDKSLHPSHNWIHYWTEDYIMS